MNRLEKIQRKRIANKQKKVLFGQLDKVYKTCSEIAAAWDLKTIPLNTLKVTLDKAKPKENADNPIIQNFIGTYDAMYSDMARISRKMGVKKVPLTELLRWINEWKKVYISAMTK